MKYGAFKHQRFLSRIWPILLCKYSKETVRKFENYLKLEQYCLNNVHLTIEKGMKWRFSNNALKNKVSNITKIYYKEKLSLYTEILFKIS